MNEASWHYCCVCRLQEQVLVVGYPTGGDNTSITSGVVSRVEVTQYVHAASHLMAIQIDAAINPGVAQQPAQNRAVCTHAW
jgi:S1-C subfamily serine protease